MYHPPICVVISIYSFYPSCSQPHLLYLSYSLCMYVWLNIGFVYLQPCIELLSNIISYIAWLYIYCLFRWFHIVRLYPAFISLHLVVLCHLFLHLFPHRCTFICSHLWRSICLSICYPSLYSFPSITFSWLGKKVVTRCAFACGHFSCLYLSVSSWSSFSRYSCCYIAILLVFYLDSPFTWFILPIPVILLILHLSPFRTSTWCGSFLRSLIFFFFILFIWIIHSCNL